MLCTKHNVKMTLLFTSYVCDICSPPKSNVTSQVKKEIDESCMSFKEAKQWMFDHPGSFVTYRKGTRNKIFYATTVYVDEAGERKDIIMCLYKPSGDKFPSLHFSREDSPETYRVV